MLTASILVQLSAPALDAVCYHCVQVRQVSAQVHNIRGRAESPALDVFEGSTDYLHLHCVLCCRPQVRDIRGSLVSTVCICTVLLSLPAGAPGQRTGARHPRPRGAPGSAAAAARLPGDSLPGAALCVVQPAHGVWLQAINTKGGVPLGLQQVTADTAADVYAAVVTAALAIYQVVWLLCRGIPVPERGMKMAALSGGRLPGATLCSCNLHMVYGCRPGQ